MTTARERTDELVAAAMRAHRIPGLSVAVVRAGAAVLEVGYGMASLELCAPATPETTYEIASITKTFTATAVLMLAERGSFELDEPIGRHLSDLPPHWMDTTVRQLVTHTSGIPNFTDQPDYWKGTRLDRPHESMLDLVRDLPLLFEPGTGWAYSSTGYYLLGFLIERSRRTDYDTALREMIFEPLGMASTRLNDPYAVVAHRAAGYTWRDGAFRNKEYYSPSGTYAAGGLLSTVSDLARWGLAFATDLLLRSEVRESIPQPGRAPTASERDQGFRMGLGWFLFERQGRRVMRHNGSIKGFSSEMARYLDDAVMIVICCNAESAGRLDLLADQIADVWKAERQVG
jgi:CubicO group peptidase (beta-lactamase class C family)